MKKFRIWLVAGVLSSLTSPLAAIAQRIAPAADGTGTGIEQQGNRFDITGGQISSDGANLFHSFERFGLSSGEIANFWSQPDIQNILGRVTGGDVSVINGLIQISGGNSNLFLINPAGVIFGPQAMLNVPGNLTVTTATAVGFEGGWFEAIGLNNYNKLLGNPSVFYFGVPTPGNIINSGTLAVTPGQDLTLLGGTVINTGILQAPGGHLIIAAVPGKQAIRIGQPGHLLSLELSDVRGDLLMAIAPLSLPELLTRTGVGHATKLQVTETGTVVLSGSGISVESGDVVLSEARAIAKTLNLIAANTLTLVGSELQGTESLNLLAQNTVQVRDGESRFAAVSGGTLRIQGNQILDILALAEHPLSSFAFEAIGDIELISNGIISADARFTTGGNFSLRNFTGEPGDFISLFDPIIRSAGSVSFGNYRGASLKIEAQENIFAGTIEIISPDIGLSNSTDPDAELLSSSPALILRSGVENIGPSATIPPPLNVGNTSFQAATGLPGTRIIVADVVIAGGPAIVESTDTITLNSIRTQGGEITLKANSDIEIGRFLDSGGGNINIASGNFLRVRGSDNNNSLRSGGGSITIQHGGGTETPFIVGDSRINGTEGAIATNSDIISPLFEIPVPPDGIFSQGNILINASVNLAELPDEGEMQPVEEIDSELPLEEEAEDATLVVEPNENEGIAGISISEPDNPVTIQPFAEIGGEIDPVSSGESPTLSEEFNENTALETPDFSERANEEIEALNDSSYQVGNILNHDPGTPFVNDNRSASVITQELISPLQTLGRPEQILKSMSRFDIAQAIDGENLPEAIAFLDAFFTETVNSYVQDSWVPADLDSLTTSFTYGVQSFSDIQEILRKISEETDTKPAIIYTFVRDKQLDVILVPPIGQPIHHSIPNAKREILLPAVTAFQNQITNPITRNNPAYLTTAQQLYQWIIEPLDSTLESLQIDTVVFAMDEGLRTFPLAALHDGEQFLIEKYSLGLIPSVNLTDTRYRSLKEEQVLAMGASTFQAHHSLYAVPLELDIIAGLNPDLDIQNQLDSPLWGGQAFLNEQFTFENLKAQRNLNPFAIVHLATHAEFQTGKPENSYIQLWDEKLRLNQVRTLGWNDPPVELLSLSACRTAVGDLNAELGFAGLAVQVGVKSALASIWSINDLGTLALMSEFYRNLKTTSIKAEALRQTQVAMIRGQIQIKDGQLILQNGEIKIVLPPELARLTGENLSIPYYWAGFTLVGSPW